MNKWQLWAPVMRQGNFEQDMISLEDWCAEGRERYGKLPRPQERSVLQRSLARTYCETMALVRAQAISLHGEDIYKSITDDMSHYLRVDELLELAAGKYPGLLPSSNELFQDADKALEEKAGFELSIGMVISHWLSNPAVGRHLMAAMRLPNPKSLELLKKFQLEGELDLGVVELRKINNYAELTMNNADSLNAEDFALVNAMELAVDVALLDGTVEVGLLRGGFMSHPKYEGKRVFCSGVDLKKLRAGKIPYLFYVVRELGLVSKLLRGLWQGESPWSDAPDLGLEKPWVAAVDTHAIGGGCQLLLVCDHVIADSEAFLSIPARSEGFIPGLANLRLPQYVGRRLANSLIYRNAKVLARSDEGMLLVDEVVGSTEMDAAIDRAISEMTAMGTKGIVSNRKAFRHGIEPVEQFRLYMSTFCREQVNCMFGSEILANLENFWKAKQVPSPVP